MKTADRIVYGWCTPDYDHWCRRLMADLDRLGEAYHFDEVARVDGGWERQTLQKPVCVAAAMKRWPDRTIILLDVDCSVRKSLAPLARISGDVGLNMKPWRSKRASVYLGVRSGTMVFRPTERARHLVSEWCALSLAAPPGAVDQHTLPQAMARVPMLAVTQLETTWCATPGDGVDDPAILHDSASKDQRKISKWVRRLHAWRMAA